MGSVSLPVDSLAVPLGTEEELAGPPPEAVAPVRQQERVSSVDEIEHPIVREALRMLTGGVRGLNITLPHKQAAAELVNELTPRAERAPDRVDRLMSTLAPHERAKVRVLDLPALNGSATLVRRQLARGGSIRYLVPGFVSTYIAEHGLYGPMETLARAD